MSSFDFLDAFDNNVNNTAINIDDPKMKPVIEKYLQYIHKETKKGRIPLIIVGSGISTSDVIISAPGDINKKGLPTLTEMIHKIREYLMKEKENSEVKELLKLFSGKNEPLPVNIDREWLAKLFTALENSENDTLKSIWEKFCNWFLLECIDEEHGALNTKTSNAALVVSRFSTESGALCFSANFDNYLTFNRKKLSHIEEKLLYGISIFNRTAAEQYFKRTIRANKENEINVNNYVLHANGDVFWLSCSGDATDGYCPKKDIYLPAFNWFSKDKEIKKEDLVCDICTSRLKATMTMPGTYKKDHDIREMIGAIWKYLSPRISTVITVGISCNWDDILLKFITGLLYENKIPHLDINNNDIKSVKTEIHKKIVKDKYFSSISLTGDAYLGMNLINNQYIKIKNESLKKPPLNFNEEELTSLFDRLDFIQNLTKVSQIGLKGFWKNASKKEIENNRWEHSKQVARIALEYYNKLMKKKLEKEKNVKEEVLVYVSGLLHDCGHLPFSHLLEEVFLELSWKFECNETPFKHGHYTSFLIRDLFESDISDSSLEQNKIKSEIRKIITEDYGVDYEDIIKVIEGNYGVGYIDALINSEIDCDKIAYLFGDSKDADVKLILKPGEFLDDLIENAHITQENFIALDSESAWTAFRLLDERKRLYNELYFASDLRFLEAAVKFILTIYFVQQYNKLDEKYYEKYKEEEYGDLSHCRIKMVIEDLFNIINKNKDDKSYIKDSLSEQTKKSLEKCMRISMKSLIKNKQSETSMSKELNEIKILKEIYKRLTGETFKEKLEDESRTNYPPYHDKDIDEFSKKLNYDQLRGIRKKIHLNFPGILLIDVYESIKYLSTAKTRRKQLRIDGTEENQVVYLVPSGDKDAWLDSKAKADTDISDYVKDHKLDIRKYTFNVYKLSNDNAKLEHAINMLKKEMKICEDNGNEEDDE
jgi:HD superfamily phosphohydrolase